MPELKTKTLPVKYVPGFLRELDRRTDVSRRLREAFDEICDDLGGQPQLSRTRLSLIERFVWLEEILQGIEQQIATRPKNSGELLSRWIQGLNSLQGLAGKIGLQRDAKRTLTLQSYVGANNGRHK
jgi:hypothetical protein